MTGHLSDETLRTMAERDQTEAELHRQCHMYGHLILKGELVCPCGETTHTTLETE